MTNTASTGPISLVGTTAPNLRFRVWFNTEGNSFDGWNLKVSTDGGTTYTPLSTVTPAYSLTVDTQACWGGNESASGWQEYSADLSAFAGMSVNLQFGMRTDGSVTRPGVYLDNIAISD